MTTTFATDGGGDSAWSDADDVLGDNVLSQAERTYDANSNVTLVTTRQRFHDDTQTGALGNPASTPPTPKARVPRLPPGARTETMIRLEKMQEDPAMNDLQPGLRELHLKVKGALDKGKTP